MNEIQVFKNEQFGEVRTIDENGVTIFCAADIARGLGYKDTVNAIKQHCRGVVKRHITDSLGRQQDACFIPEGDVYRLITHSKLPSAEKFERWVFDEVLPTIRRHGAYATGATIESIIADPESGIKLLQALKSEQERRKEAEALCEEQRPKALFADAVAASDNCILIGELAKILRQNGVETGQNRLFRWMRDNGYIMRFTNTPTQYSMERGLMELKERTINNPDGSVRITQTTLVTGKGQQYFINKILRRTC